MADVKYADGTVAVTPDNRVGAGDLGEWNLVFTLEEEPLPPGSATVSYTHLTLPTNREV